MGELVVKFILMGTFTALVLLLLISGNKPKDTIPPACPENLRILSLEQKMRSRTDVIKTLGREHNLDIMFIAE